MVVCEIGMWGMWRVIFCWGVMMMSLSVCSCNACLGTSRRCVEAFGTRE